MVSGLGKRLYPPRTPRWNVETMSNHAPSLQSSSTLITRTLHGSGHGSVRRVSYQIVMNEVVIRCAYQGGLGCTQEPIGRPVARRACDQQGEVESDKSVEENHVTSRSLPGRNEDDETVFLERFRKRVDYDYQDQWSLDYGTGHRGTQKPSSHLNIMHTVLSLAIACTVAATSLVVGVSGADPSSLLFCILYAPVVTCLAPARRGNRQQ